MRNDHQMSAGDRMKMMNEAAKHKRNMRWGFALMIFFVAAIFAAGYGCGSAGAYRQGHAEGYTDAMEFYHSRFILTPR